MQTSEHLKTVMNELLQTTALIADDEAEQLVNGIISSKKCLSQEQAVQVLWASRLLCV